MFDSDDDDTFICDTSAVEKFINSEESDLPGERCVTIIFTHSFVEFQFDKKLISFLTHTGQTQLKRTKILN